MPAAPPFLLHSFSASLLSLTLTISLFAAPPKRAHHALAYDEARERIVLTSGSTPTNGGRSFLFFNDYWEFDGTRWAQMPATGDKLSGIGLAFDPRQKRLVSFGGFNGREVGDLRIRDQDAWRTISRHPEMVIGEPGFVYDTQRERFVVFGGSSGRGQANGDTWESDGSKWSKVATASPPARQSHIMIFDQNRGKTVVFGGMGAGQGRPGQPPPMLGDTWEFDGQAWEQKKVQGPSARNGVGAAYDSKRGLVILFGGSSSDGFKGDTWSWDGAQWKRLATTGPEPRAMGYMAYDKKRDRIVLFGGRKGYPNGDLNDTWEWEGTKWNRVDS